MDGQRFVLLENLRTHSARNEEIMAEDGTWVKFEDYLIFLKQDEKIRFDKPKQTHNMEQKDEDKPKIYFSYAWGEEREKFVDELYDSLKQDGYALVRDKVDLGYKGLISEFMKGIGKGNFVVVAISDKYLKSEYCMYELYELYRNSKLEKNELLQKIYPIRVESVNLNNPAVRKGYYEYWKNLELETKELVNEYGEDQSKHRMVEAIKISLRDLLLFLNDINTLTQEDLSANNFTKIKMALQERAKTIVRLS